MALPRNTSRVALAVALVAALALGSCDSARESGRPPTGSGRATDPANLIVITLDTTRADRLGCYGHAAAETPNIDRLAAEGVLVSTAIAVAPLTLPSHASLLTGLYPPAHGVRDNADYRLPSGALTLAEHLGQRGYATAAVVGAQVLSAEFGLAQGFEVYDEPLEPALGAAGGAEVRYRPMLERPAAEVTDAALGLLGPELPQPFFLWVHYFDPHMEYEPPEPYRGRFADRPYEGELAYLDAQLGRLLEGLRQRELLDRSLLALTADHGESLGEHGEETHSMFVYEASLRVPLILRWRGVLPEGRTVDRLVSGVDLAPTLLELLALPTIDGAEGESFADAARGRSQADREPAYAESQRSLRAYGWAPLLALHAGTSKFIEAPEPELYDLERDPGEARNLAPSSRGEVASWQDRLRALEDRWGPPDSAAEHTLDPEQRARLESLGYLSGSAGTDDRDDRPDPKRMVHLHNALIQARARLSIGQRAAARALVERVLEEDPQNPAALALGGTLAYGAGTPEQGLAMLREAVRQAPDSYEARRNLANALHLAGRFEEAAGAYRAALAIRPASGEDRFGLANVLFASGDVDGALPVYREAIDEGFDGPRVRAALGVALAAAGENEQARQSLRQAVNADPGLAGAWTQLGILAEKSGDREEARRLYARALQAEPDDPDALFNHAKVSLMMGEATSAKRGVERLIEVRPDYPAGRYLEAQVWLSLGDRDRARRALEAFLSLENANPGLARSAAELLQELQGPAGSR